MPTRPYLKEIIKVVLSVCPAVVGLQTVGLIGDVPRVEPFTDVELSFEQLGREKVLIKKDVWLKGIQCVKLLLCFCSTFREQKLIERKLEFG